MMDMRQANSQDLVWIHLSELSTQVSMRRLISDIKSYSLVLNTSIQVFDFHSV